MCGIVGVITKIRNAGRKCLDALIDVEHRGQQSGAIYIEDEDSSTLHRWKRVVSDFDSTKVENEGYIALGHQRYRTSRYDSKGIEHAFQPIEEGDIVLVHNGNMDKRRLEFMIDEMDIKLDPNRNYSDSELLAKIIANTEEEDFKDRLTNVLSRIGPSYSLIIKHEDKMYAIRDSTGKMPLSVGEIDEGYIVASEPFALHNSGARNIRDINPGELLEITADSIQSYQVFEPEPHPCIMQLIYMAKAGKADENEFRKVFDISIQDYRIETGRRLAEEAGSDADIVIGLPDSGYYASVGYADAIGRPNIPEAVENRAKGQRSFMKDTQEERDEAAANKYWFDKEKIEGKRVALVDDSNVRGTTLYQTIRQLREAGATGIDIRIASETIEHPCYFGVDIPDEDELISHKLNKEQLTVFGLLRYYGVDYERDELIEIAKGQNIFNITGLNDVIKRSVEDGKNYLGRVGEIDVEKVTFAHLSLKGMIEATGLPADKLCAACMSEDYRGTHPDDDYVPTPVGASS